jgi:uncharacterized protein YdaU (DUF1376 family)
MSDNSPAFQFYPGDFLSDPKVIVMTTEEVGAYWLLLCAMWKAGGSLTNDLELLSNLARKRKKTFEKLWTPKLEKCFFVDGQSGQLRNTVIDFEIEKQRANRAKKKHAAEERWSKVESTRNADAMQVHSKSNALHSSSSSSPSTANTELRSGDDIAVDEIPVERRIWKDGVDLLLKAGMKEADARSFLGGTAKEYGRPVLGEAIAATQAANSPDPKAYIIQVCRNRKNGRADMQVGKWNGDDDFTPEDPCEKCGSDVCLGGQSCADRAAARTQSQTGANQ